MVLDILIVLFLIVVAIALGLAVHPLFWLILILAAVWIIFRSAGHHRL